MGQLKEADFMRWGNTKRMTGLRKAEQDGMWEGVKDRALALSSFLFLRIVGLTGTCYCLQTILTITGASRLR
jgi:hypothetical protein